MEIYKVHVLDNTGKTSKIMVFGGNAIQNIENPNIFSETERLFLQTNQIEPIFLTSQIHNDDSIRIIKKKIIASLNIPLSYDEIYLFSNIQKKGNSRNIYDSIYKQGNDFLDKNTFSQFLKNMNIPFPVEEKTKFLFEDIEIILSNQSLTTKISLGINFASAKDESFSCNPFDLLSKFLYEGTSENALLSLDNRLLMNFSTKIIDNIIYLSIASDIFDFLERNGNNVQKTIPLYFPLLAKREIYEKSDLLKQQTKLIKETQKIMDKKVFQIYDNVDLLHDVFHGRKSEIPYVERGIQSLQICIHPDEIQLLPLDAIFKNIHATKTNPFIKYNPGTRRENIYRLFAKKINKYGAKIPFLKRTKIIQLSKDIGKSKQISFYIPYVDGGKTIDILLTLTHNSNIFIDCVFETAKKIDELNEIIVKHVNPIIHNINSFLNQSGYQLHIFDTIKNEMVEIVKMTYLCKVPVQRKITLLNEGYVSAIFDVVEENISKGAIVKYKRVENYEEMNAETSLIMNWFMENGRMNREEIIKLLMDYSDIGREESLLKIDAFLRDHTIIKGKYVNSSEDILENAGFLTKMGILLEDDLLYVEIQDIRSIDYIKNIQIYIDSILRLKQFPETTDIPSSRILEATKHIINANQTDKSHIENVVEVTKAKPLTFGITYEEEEDEPTGLVFEDYDEEEQQSSKTETPSYDSDFITHLDDYQDAEIGEIETIDTAELPAISINASKDIDEPEEEDELYDNDGIIFDEYDDVSDHEEEQEKEKGGAGEEIYEKELDGLLLREKNNNIFLKRLKKKEPTLYLTQDIGKQYSRYSRLCQSFKQPVVISDAEKQKIDADHEGSYTNALQYGTDPNNKSWYICPRFWCLKTNTSITEEQVKSGMCGKVIPKGEDKVPPGHYVYEFDRQKHESPGFLTSDNLHPDGYCLPCCFKNWDSKLQEGVRKKCATINTGERIITKTKNLTILKIEAIPIDQHRYGFLPMNVQRFLRIDYSKVVEKDNPTILNGETLLRYGVPQSKNKSFIGCISDIYSKKKVFKETMTIKQMCDIIINALSIDLFIKIHNGSLPAIFRKGKSVDETRYLYYIQNENSMFVKTIDLSNDSQKRFLDETIASYEHFLDFIRNEKSVLDYTYLWDIVCTPNPKLFEVGLNLVIMDVTNNDNTDNLELICPSSAYSKTYYDSKKETVIFIKNEEIFEPVYLINPISETYTFFESTVNPNLKQILKIIRKTTQNYCAPISSIRTYEFKRNKLAEEVRLHLLKYKYSILSQVQNSQGKIIGFQVNVNDVVIIIPCLPSAFLPDIPIKYINDDNLWLDYETTRDTLVSVFEKSQGAVMSNPVIKVIEDGLIVGILTETNQFLQIDPPSENIHQDHLKELKGSNYILADKAISKKKEDSLRVRTVKMISLETQFYSSFRSLIRILLNEYENKDSKQQIIKYSENKNAKYTNAYRLKSIEYIIRKLCNGRVEFIDYSEDVLMSLNEITNCEDDDGNKKYCLMRDSQRVLICPKKHLISGANNEIIYFGRIADEIMRYKRIQTFMLEPKTFLNISNTNYIILDNEMILLESLLTKDYFEDLLPRNQNKSMNITYDIAYPKISQRYSNKIDLETQQKITEEKTNDNEFDILCIKEIKEVVGNPATNIWKKRFPSNVREIFFNETRECSFYPILYILRDLYKTEFTISQIKENLKNAYQEYVVDFQEKIITILKKQGKREMMDLVIRGKHTFEEIILSEGYYLTNLDIWILADTLKLPIVLFTSNKLKHLVDSISWLVLGKNPKTDKYYFLRAYTEPLSSGQFSDYHIISPALKFSEIKGFQNMVDMGLKGQTEYSKNVQQLDDFLEE